MFCNYFKFYLVCMRKKDQILNLRFRIPLYNPTIKAIIPKGIVVFRQGRNCRHWQSQIDQRGTVNGNEVFSMKNHILAIMMALVLLIA